MRTQTANLYNVPNRSLVILHGESNVIYVWDKEKSTICPESRGFEVKIDPRTSVEVLRWGSKYLSLF